MSHFKMILMTKFPYLRLFNNEQWYTKMRKNISLRYDQRAEVTNEILRKKALNFDNTDMIFACKILLNERLNTRQKAYTGYEDRCLIIWDRHCCGRIVETGSLKPTKIDWCPEPRCIKVKFLYYNSSHN